MCMLKIPHISDPGRKEDFKFETSNADYNSGNFGDL